MSVQIKVGLLRRKTRPATWGDVVTNLMWMGLAIVFAYPLMPTIAERTAMSDRTGLLFAVTFALIAVMHAYDAYVLASRLRKQKVAA